MMSRKFLEKIIKDIQRSEAGCIVEHNEIEQIYFDEYGNIRPVAHDLYLVGLPDINKGNKLQFFNIYIGAVIGDQWYLGDDSVEAVRAFREILEQSKLLAYEDRMSAKAGNN